MPEYKLDFPVNVGSATPMRGLSDAVREVADRTKLGEGNLRLFTQILGETAQRTGSLKTALNDLASKQNIFQEFAKNVQTYSRETEKAQTETQKLGRMMELAYGENAKRNLDAFKKAQQEAQKETQQLGRDLQNLSRALPGSGGMLGSGLAGLFGAGAGGAGAIAAGGAGLIAALTGAATLMVKLANETGEYAREQQNLAARTGLTLRETQEFSQIAQVAGVNVGSLTTAMRTLSKGLSENSEEGKQAKQALKELGLDASVAFEPTGRAMEEIFQRLGAINSGLERDRLAITLFGRGGLELLPMVEQFKELEARVKSAGNVMDEAGIQKAAEYQRQVTLLGQSWDQLKRTMGEKAIGIIQVQLGGKELSIGGIADLLTTGGAFGAYQDYIAAPKGPAKPSLTAGLPDPYAVMKQQRSQQMESLAFTAGTPRQRLEAQLKQAEADRTSANSRYIESGNPADLQKYKDLNKEIGNLQARLDGLKKTAVSFAEELARYANHGETNEFARRISENRGQATALERQFPGHRGAIEGQEYSNLAQINAEAKAEIAKFQAHLQSEGEQEAEKFYTEQVKILAGSPEQQKQKTLQFRTGTGLTIEDYAQLYRTGKPAFEEQIKGVSDTATQQTQALQLQQALNSGVKSRGRASGQLSAQQLAGMDFSDQLAFILKQSSIQQNEFGTQADMYRQRAASSYGTDRQELLDKATEAEAKAKEAETKATIEAVDAVNKFQEAAEEASAKLREQFGSFISGLAAAGREGHAGTYARNFMLGQSDKIIGNFASSMYQPGMMEFPGQGTPQNPTPLAKMFQGTMFGMDPKAHSGDALASVNDALKSTTDQNTKATVDNTTVMAAVYQALGGDPTSLGLSNLPAMPSLTGGASTGALPFLGAAGVAGASSAAAVLSTGLKAAGISVPGITTSAAAASSSPISAITSLFRASASSPAGSSSSSASDLTWPSMASDLTQLANGGNSSSPLTDNWTSMAQDLDQLANGGSGNPGLTSTMSALAKTGSLMTGPLPSASELANAGSSSSAFFTASNPLTNLLNVNGTASPGQQVGAGLGVAGEAFGAYKGISQAFKGGAQNITGGIGETAMSIAPLLGPAAPFVEAGGAVLSLISSLMGDPRANRQASINHELFNNQYIAPQAINRTMDISGGYADVNFQGNVRATDLSSIPVLQQAYPDPRHGVIVPGTVLSPFGGGGSPTVVGNGNFGGLTTDSGSNGHTVNVTNNVSAIDGDSVASFFQNNAQALGDGIVHAINTGGSDMANRLRTL